MVKEQVQGPGRLWLLLAVASLSVSTPVLVQTQSGVALVLPRVEAVVKLEAQTRQLLVDPLVVQEIAASVLIFTGNFCDSGRPLAQDPTCQQTLFDARVSQDVIGRFLDDAVAGGKPEIETVAARLARAANSDIAKAGWPRTITNSYAVVELTGLWSGSAVSVRTAAGATSLGTGRRLLTQAGTRELVAQAAKGGRLVRVLQLRPGVHVSVEDGAAEVAESPAIAGRIDAPPQLFCSAPPTSLFDLPPENPLLPFDWGRERLIPTGRDTRAPIASSIGLDIEVRDRSGTCDGSCRDRIAVAFVQAIAAWRGGCARCDPHALSLVRIGTKVWANWRIVTRLDRLRARPGSVNLDLEVTDLSEAQGQRWGFEQIDSDPDRVQSVCRADPNAGPWVPAAQRLLCPSQSAAARGRDDSNGSIPPRAIPGQEDRPTPGRERSEPRQPLGALLRSLVTLIPGDTACGVASGTLACGLPDQGIEISLAGATWRGQALTIDTSNGSINLFPVILHEVGHWFGVPHSQIVGPPRFIDVMSDVYGDGPTCLSPDTLIMLNNAADLRWPFRVSEGKGLKRRRN